MDIQLQELIDKIKKDGVESASVQAEKIIQDAQSEARKILEAAKKEADTIVAAAKRDAERSEKAGIAAIEQASRNLLLSFQSEIQKLLDAVVRREVSASFDDEALKTALPQIIIEWARKDKDDLAVLLQADTLAKLEGYFAKKLSAELAKGVELKSDRNLAAGFRIASKDGSAYYDFSAEAVAELMSAYLNPRLAELIKSVAKGL
ncbi:MAG: V-type ATP synthase subunit E [Treponema sp.]|nr:V-type ATP synthase subunit E [Treponema sp.]